MARPHDPGLSANTMATLPAAASPAPKNAENAQ